MAQLAYDACPTVVSSSVLSWYKSAHNGARKTHAEWYADDSVSLFRARSSGRGSPDYLRLKRRHLHRLFTGYFEQQQAHIVLSIPGEGTKLEMYAGDDGSIQFVKRAGKGRQDVSFRLFPDEIQAFVDFCAERLVDL